MKDLSPVTFICGGAANGLATVISYPFDTIRTRFIGQGKPPVSIISIHWFKSLKVFGDCLVVSFSQV